MINFLSSIIIGIATGLVSSTLVVVYFEYRQNKKHKLSQAHLLHRFIVELFHILTIVRVTVKLPHPTLQDESAVIEELEEILDRKDPSVLLNRITALTKDQHKYLYEQLASAQHVLNSLFSDSVAHKTMDGKVPASVAETQEWIGNVLIGYQTFPEIFDNKINQMIMMQWATSIMNLTENTFAILKNMVSIKNTPDEMLRWGSRVR